MGNQNTLSFGTHCVEPASQTVCPPLVKMDVLTPPYLQHQAVVDLGEEGQVVVDVTDGDGDQDRRGQRRVAFVRCLHCQRVVRRLWSKKNKCFL